MKLLIWLDGHGVAWMLAHCYLCGCARIGQLCWVDRLLVVLVGTLFTDWILGAVLLFHYNSCRVLYISCVLASVVLFVVTRNITGPLAFFILDKFVWLLCLEGALWVLKTLVLLLSYVLVDEVATWWHQYFVPQTHRWITQSRVIVLLYINSGLA